MTFSLQIVEGAGAGTAVPVLCTLVIGRGPDVDMTVADSRVSPRHVRVTVTTGSSDDPAGSNPRRGGAERNGNGVIVEDLGSCNGTFVNGQCVREPTWLAPGDELLVGATVMTLSGFGLLAPEHLSADQDGDRVYRLPGDWRPSAELEQSEPGRLGSRELRRLFDASVKHGALMAPPVLLAVVCLVVAVYLMGH